MKKASEVGVDQKPTSNQKPGTSKDDLPSNPNIAQSIQQLNIQSSEQADEPMKMDFCGLSLLPRFGQGAHSKYGSDPNGLDHTSKQSEQGCLVKAKKHADRVNIRLGQNISHSHLRQRNQSPLYK